MKLYIEKEQYKLYQGNMLDMLEVIEPNTIDSIVTDPPYELGFMGKSWDNTGIAFKQETWEKCYKVLKPGGYLLAFGGTRTYHRIACAIEDAGFEIRDCIMWLYGSGFPKSMALDKALEGKLTIGSANKTEFHKLNGEYENKHHYGFTTSNKEQGFRPKDYTTEGESDKYLKKLDATTELAKIYKGWGTALKPSYEPIIVARKPFKGSLVDNVIKYGVGGINIDECRVAFNGDKWKNQKSGNTAKAFNLNEQQRTAGTGILAGFECKANDNGRFPANTILTYDETDFEEVCGGFPHTKGDSRKSKPTYDKSIWGNAKSVESSCLYNDSGSASRYFYCAKASKKDRDEGLDIEEQVITDGRNKPIDNAFNRGETLRKNIHPTVKPTELMQYLVRMVSPKGSTILDCFMGSGSTGKAVMFENREREANYKFIGIELTEEYLPICEARIDYAINKYEYDFQKELEEARQEGQLNIFDLVGDK